MAVRVCVLLFLLFPVIKGVQGHPSTFWSGYSWVFNKKDSVETERLLKSALDYLDSDYHAALRFSHDAYLLSSKRSATKLHQRVIQHLGRLYFYKGQYDLATQYYSELLSIAHQQENTEMIGRAYFLLGSIRLVIEDYTEARDYTNKAIKLFVSYYGHEDSIPEKIRLGLHNNMGVLYLGLKQYEDSKHEYDKGLSLAKGTEEHRGTYIQLLNNVGDYYFHIGNYQKALEYYEEGLVTTDTASEKLFCSMFYNSIGKASIELGKYSDALSFFRNGFALALQADGYSHLKHLSAGLAEAFQELNQSDSALYYLKLSKRYEDSLKIRQAAEKLIAEELQIQLAESGFLANIPGLIDKRSLHMISIFFTFIIGLLSLKIIYYYRNSKIAESEMLVVESQLTALKEKNDTLYQTIEEEHSVAAISGEHSKSTNKLLAMVAQEMKAVKEMKGDEDTAQLQKILRELRHTKSEAILSDFEVQFGIVFEDFFEQLKLRYPSLTPNERRLCAFLKLQLSTKEIATITGQSLRAVEIGRTRLRKKLQLTNADVSLSDFFLSWR